MGNWSLGRVLLPIFWCWTVKHSCKLMERKPGVSVRATESQTQEKMDHSCTVHRSTSCHCQHPTNPTLLPQLQKGCGTEGYSLQGKTKYFSGQGEATRKIGWENCYSLSIAVWDSNDSHLRPMTSASELEHRGKKKGFTKKAGNKG